MDKKILSLYSTYLQASFSQVTATGLSTLLEGALSHDKITRFLSSESFTSKDLWTLVKKDAREQEVLHLNRSDKVLIFDDHIAEKAYSSENDLICWHYDHSKDRNIKGINQLSVLYNIGETSIPVAYDFVYKTEYYWNKKKKKECRRSSETKNEKFRCLLRQCHKNKLSFGYVLADSWYCSKENMETVKVECSRDFIFAAKTNRLVALSKEDADQGHYQGLKSLCWEKDTAIQVWVKGLDFPILALQEVFKNKDGSTVVNYLFCSDLSLDYEQITTIYEKRWKVEEHHKSVKSNLGYAKSPTHTVRTQTNHCFIVLYAFFDWERLTRRLGTNHFALKSKIYENVVKNAFKEITTLKEQLLAA